MPNPPKKLPPKKPKPKPENVPLGTGLADRARDLLRNRNSQLDAAILRANPPPRPPDKKR